MAVDSNVLIYERMREELDRGATLRMAIRNGFERAFSAIFDSHLTTLISAAVLFFIGEEQIKGFAVTLFMGVAINLYTAVFCVHVAFDVAERQGWIGQAENDADLHQSEFRFLGTPLQGVCCFDPYHRGRPGGDFCPLGRDTRLPVC